MKKNIFLFTVLSGLIFWTCSKVETENKDLKQVLQDRVEKVNTALAEISSSEAYRIISVNESDKKSEEAFNDSITLDLIAGIYDYQPDFMHRRNFYIPYSLFKRTGNSDNMIVNLPERLILHPRYLHDASRPDSALSNNFRIEATDYHYYFTWFNKFDYSLSAGFKLDSEDLGSLDVHSSANPDSDRSFSSIYNFTEGYSVDVSQISGDTTQSSFALYEGDEVLLKETVIFSNKDYHKRERQYILTIGNIDIKRSTGVDSILVYLDGVLQKEAAAKIIDSTENNGSICYHRDIQLTFDDGTTTNLSTLINPSLTTLKTLVQSLHGMYFAKNVVDYIAVGIYYHSRYQ